MFNKSTGLKEYYKHRKQGENKCEEKILMSILLSGLSPLLIPTHEMLNL